MCWQLAGPQLRVLGFHSADPERKRTKWSCHPAIPSGLHDSLPKQAMPALLGQRTQSKATMLTSHLPFLLLSGSLLQSRVQARVSLPRRHQQKRHNSWASSPSRLSACAEAVKAQHVEPEATVQGSRHQCQAVSCPLQGYLSPPKSVNSPTLSS